MAAGGEENSGAEEGEITRLPWESEPQVLADQEQKFKFWSEMLSLTMLKNMDAFARLHFTSDKINFPNNFITELAKNQVTFLGSLRDAPDMLHKFAMAYNNFAGQKLENLQKMRHTNTLH